MLELVKARWFGMRRLERNSRMPPTSVAELTMLCDYVPPCCSHVALCDGTCRDAQTDAPWRDSLSARDDTK